MNSLDQYPDVLNVDDIREILGVGRRQAYELVSSGQVPHCKSYTRVSEYGEQGVRTTDHNAANVESEISYSFLLCPEIPLYKVFKEIFNV